MSSYSRSIARNEVDDAVKNSSDTARPVFLTRQQREAEALKRLEQRRANNRNNFIINNEISSQSETNINNNHNNENPTDKNNNSSDEIDDFRVKELALIKAQHLGQKLDRSIKQPKLNSSSSAKTRFAFDWNASDDTAQDPYALYTARHETKLLFGRGFVGGVDRSEQRKTQNKIEDERKFSNHKNPNNPHNNDREIALLSSTRHWSEKSLNEMSERDWRIFKEDFEITTRGARIPRPLRSWRESPLPSSILRSIESSGFKDPTPIQRVAIPVGLQNRDIIAIAETGSGKTAAFLIPMLVFLSQKPRINAQTAELGPYALIMAPTRELAQQISAECNKFSSELNIRNACIVGGLTIEEQGLKLRQGVELVIGTPGRLIDCIEKHFLVLDQCFYVVLDEADRMIDMNFEPQINTVMETMPATNLRPMEEEEAKNENNKNNNENSDVPMNSSSSPRYRQTVMFTATMPPKVNALAKKYLRSPVEVAVGDRRGAVNSNVELKFVWTVSESDKKFALNNLVRDKNNFPMIIFCNLKRTCDFVSRLLTDGGIKCSIIHGSKTQDIREESLAMFKNGSIDVLIATDVLGRGIDISNVQHVINFELPGDLDKFTHRIGRTGRAGQKGSATSFINEEDSGIFFELKQLLEKSGQPIPQQLQNHEAAKFKFPNKKQKLGEE